MAKELNMLNKSLQENLDLTAYSQVGHTHNYAGSSTVGGAANTAVKLHTAKSINGTNFDGSGNITTANWGTARNITIGDASKSVNGSGNVGWTLAEIGAAPTFHNHTFIESVDTRDTNPNPDTYTTRGITPEFKSASGIGLPNVGKNFAGVITYQQWDDLTQWSGGKATQFATIDDGRMYYRKGDGSGWESWYQFYTTQNKPTYSDVGAAKASHGTHVTYATATPSANGTAAVGSSAKVAREDHVHPLQTTISGAAGSAEKWTTARTLTIGNTGKSVDGSANVSWSLSEIGALPTAGGTMTGNIKFTDVTSTTYPAKSAMLTWNGSTDGADIYYQVDANDKGRLVLNTRDDTDCIIAFANKGTTVSTIDNSGNFSGKASKAGNADTATKLATGRSITIGNQAQTFDGSGNISFSVASIGASESGHTHNYAGSSSAGGAANSVKTNLIIKLNNGGTEGTNLFTFNGSTAKTVNITPNAIGAAASSHGTHVTYSTSAPLVAGTAAVGSANNVARGDHVHPAQTSVTGNAGTATKLATARTIAIGNKSNTFDGSANITYTLAEIGAAAASHTHTIANITDLRIKNGATTGITIADPYQSWAHDNVKNNDIIFGGSYNGHTTTDANIVFASGNGKINMVIDGEYYAAEGKQRVYHTGYKPSPSDIGAAASSHGTHVTYSTTAPLVAGTAAVGSANNVSRGDHVHPAQTSVSGNAGTATKLATARTIQIGNKSNTFDGSANITYTLADIGAAATGHTHNQINNRGKVTCESGVTGRPAVSGLSMSEAYNNGYPTPYGNVISLKGAGDGQILVGWSGTDGAHAPVYVRSKRDNTSTANWSDWAQLYTTANKPTYSDVGAAAASHGTHVTYATATPKANGTAAIGSVNRVAREDHVHPLQTSVSGNAGTATKLATARTITIGNKSNTFDGSANISYTLADIGAATSGHTHNYAGSSSAGGAANSAVKLSSARTINGTSFDGSANITTANWGTARKINQISVNGSADVKLPLDYYTCNIGSSNAKPYHHILTTGQCAGDYTDKSITIVLVNHYNSAGLGIAKATLRTNQASAGSGATGELRWLVRSGFAENQLCFNIRNTAKDTYMDVFYKSTGTYNSLTWYVLTEGARGSHGSQWTKYNTHHDNGTNVYDETGMKAIRTYTATLQSAADHGAVNSAKTAAACSGNAATATTLQTARSIALGGLLSGSASFDGSANITINASVAKPPKSGDWFSGGIPIVNTDGVMEVGKYIDFHNTDASTNDYDVRLQANTSTPCVITLPSGGGTLARTSDNITGNAATATKLATARTLTIGSTGKTFDGSGNVSWTLAEIGAAASSHGHNSITYQDTRSVNTTAKDVPNGLSVHLKSNGSDGISDGGSYHPVLMMKPWNDKSGWPVGQLAVTQNNNLYFRVSSGADDTSWNAWKKVSLDGHTHSAGGTVTAVNSNLSSVTINSYDSIMSSINTNIGKL